jgi:hypothetical protein
VIHYLVCEGQKIETVRLSTPAGRTIWEIHSDKGSTETTYDVGKTPPGFTQVTPFRGLAPVTRVDGPDGDPAMSFSDVPKSGILRGDGKLVTPAQFASGRGSYCGAVRQDRAAALAVGFVFLVLLGLFLVRWVRAKQSRDPYRRPWRKD